MRPAVGYDGATALDEALRSNPENVQFVVEVLNGYVEDKANRSLVGEDGVQMNFIQRGDYVRSQMYEAFDGMPAVRDIFLSKNGSTGKVILQTGVVEARLANLATIISSNYSNVAHLAPSGVSTSLPETIDKSTTPIHQLNNNSFKQSEPKISTSDTSQSPINIGTKLSPLQKIKAMQAAASKSKLNDTGLNTSGQQPVLSSTSTILQQESNQSATSFKSVESNVIISAPNGTANISNSTTPTNTGTKLSPLQKLKAMQAAAAQSKLQNVVKATVLNHSGQQPVLSSTSTILQQESNQSATSFKSVESNVIISAPNGTANISNSTTPTNTGTKLSLKERLAAKKAAAADKSKLNNTGLNISGKQSTVVISNTEEKLSQQINERPVIGSMTKMLNGKSSKNQDTQITF